MTQRDHTVLATILAIVGLYIIGLSSYEIQPWDEGLYAVRGEGIVLHGTVWDQTSHALGGLYSSTAPPMTSWGVAAGVTLFGRTAFGVRIFTLLCSALALYLLYHVGRRLTDHSSALAAVVALGVALHWVVYSRQAMTEVPLMMFTLLALWSSFDLRKLWWVFGLALAGAMMTKMTVSLMPLLFLLPAIMQARSTGDRRLIGLCVMSAILGLALAAPWYITMALKYGDAFWLALTVPHVSTAVEGNTGTLGPLTYVNQLLIGQPLTIVAFFYVAACVMKRSLLPSWFSTSSIIVLWWVVSMLVFGLAATKNPHYVVMLLPGAVLTALIGYQKIVEQLPRRMVLVMMDLVLIAALWSFIPPLRAALKHPFADPLMAAFLLLMIIQPLITLVAPTRIVDALMVRGLRPVIALALCMAALSAVSVAMKGRPEDIVGGRRIAATLMDEAELRKSFAYLYHRRNAGDAMNPQLAWYTAGWMNGADPDYTYEPLAMPTDVDDVSISAQAAVSLHPWVVYYHPGIADDVVRSVTATLGVTYTVEISDEHYTLFKKR
jgi:4-amino-4-deoxy-L-arabinose transferase-like glycosyltransferase